MKDLKIILIVLFIIWSITFISLQHEKANAYHTELQKDSSNSYHCLLAESRWASEQYLINTGCND